MSVSQPQASEQYERWKKYPKTYAEPTHEDWLRELSSARSEVEMLRAALEPFLKALENSGAATLQEEGARVQIEKEKNANG